jgi:hypothetical protein
MIPKNRKIPEEFAKDIELIAHKARLKLLASPYVLPQRKIQYQEMVDEFEKKNKKNWRSSSDHFIEMRQYEQEKYHDQSSR